MTDFLHLKRNSIVAGTVKNLPASKSLSNRALIIQALSARPGTITNLSRARDTQLMQQLIGSTEEVIDVLDAGTTMRFLTAYFAATGRKKTLTGTARMRQRPIGLLVDALRDIGVTIRYLKEDGFPPHQIVSFDEQLGSEVTVPGNVSSQFISALMMIAPVLPKGLTIHLSGAVASRPYLDMTVALMSHFGVTPKWEGNSIVIAPGAYQPAHYHVEPDWSAASYWFAVTALAEQARLVLPGVESKALQGDRVVVDIMRMLGVDSKFEDGNLTLTKLAHESTIEWNFTHCPDLAQTVLPVCAAKGVSGTFTGLESLRIKETDRIAAMQNELAKIGAQLTEGRGNWHLKPASHPLPKHVEFDTYHDHRMAMGLAPLATLMDVQINGPEAVNKSYPDFWLDMKSLGFIV